MKLTITLLVVVSCFLTSVYCVEEEIQYNAGTEAVPDEYVVTLKKDILASKPGALLTAFIKKIKEKYGCTIKKQFSFDKIRLLRIKGVFEKIQQLKALAEVAFVEKNLYVKAFQDTPSNASVCYDENTGRNLWGLSRISRRDKMPLILRAGYSWGSKDGGEGVDAYILDTGIDINHSDFEGRARWGFTSSSINEVEEDFQGHGTHVAGTVGSRTYGVAKKANLVAVKVLNGEGVGTMADIIEGIEFAYNEMVAKETSTGKKAKVVLNLSLGGKGRIQALERAIEQATEAGMVVVVAAGNEYDDACLYSPAHITSAITVGSMNSNDKLSEFSNYGTCVDILAAGEGILSTYPGGDTAISQGTSMAAPHVAGAVARYLSRVDPPPTPQEVKEMMLFDSTKDKINLGVGDDPTARATTPNRLLYMTCGGPSLQNGAAILRQNIFIGVIVVLILMIYP